MRKRILLILAALLFGFLLVGCDDKEKPSYDMSGVTFESLTIEYDGTPKSLVISGTLPEGVTVTYLNNDKTETGTYDVTAVFTGSEEYKDIPSLTAVLTIVKTEEPLTEASLPDLTNKSQEEITSELNDLGFNNIKFEEVFTVKIFKGRYVKYNNHEVGDIVNLLEQIVVSIATRKLPDITNIRVVDIKAFFLAAGITESNIVAIPSTGGDPEFVLGYHGNEVGDEYTTGQIRYLYNGSDVKLPDLTGYTVPQIDAYLLSAGLTADYHKIVDNSKEMDTFNMYIGTEAGTIVPKGTNLSIILYDNDDIFDENQLFISKSVEASPGNNGLELYNPLTTSIDLSDYYLSIFEDGAITETYRIDLSGTLAAQTTYFIASETSNENIKSKAHFVSPSLVFDGNDTIQLRKKSNNTYIDVIYNVGNTTHTFADEIFVRRQHITKGNRSFNINEWAGYVPTFLEIINNHPYEILGAPTFELLDEIFPNYGMTKVKYKSAADGDTVYFDSLDPRDPGPYDGNSRLRFLMVDTPETEKPGQEGQPYAQVASNFTKNALSTASEIYIQSDRSAGIKDNYGRNLGVVWYNAGTPESPDWRLLNYELVKNGLGEPAGIKDQGGNYMLSNVWGNRYMYQWVQEGILYATTNKLGLYSGVYQP